MPVSGSSTAGSLGLLAPSYGECAGSSAGTVLWAEVECDFCLEEQSQNKCKIPNSTLFVPWDFLLCTFLTNHRKRA